MIYGFKALLCSALVAVAMSFGMSKDMLLELTSTSGDVDDSPMISPMISPTSTMYQNGYNLGVCQTKQDYNLDCNVGDCGEQYLDSLMVNPEDDAEKQRILDDPDYSAGREQGVVDTLPAGTDRSVQCHTSIDEEGNEECPCVGGCCW